MNNLSSYNSLSKKDRIDFYIALAVIISVLSFILYFSFSDLFADINPKKLDANSVEIQLDDTIFIEGREYVPLTIEHKSKNKINPIEPSDNILPVAIIDSSLNESITQEEIGDLGSEIIDEKEIILKDTLENIATFFTKEVDSTEYISVEKTIKEVAVVEKEIIDVEETKIKEPKPEKAIVDKSCLIAVGLYKIETNAKKMTKRLEDGGYSSFITSRGNKYQVQVYHECNSASLNKSLKSIRKNYASDAVVLIKN